MQVILIYSGGLDSTVLLSKLLKDEHQVRCLSINYGQRHSRELDAARLICLKMSVEHRIADLTELRDFLKGSSQSDPSVPVPHGHYAEENMKLTVVPNRNALMLSVAFAWAFSTKADAVAYAAHAGDHAIYPDCRESFTTPFAEAMLNADWHKVALLRPFLSLTKSDIVKLGYSIHAPIQLSYSCYEGKDSHCGICGTCSERRTAFRDAGVCDPTEYDPEALKVAPLESLVS